MREPVGNGGWYLCDWNDEPDFEYTEFPGRQTLARQWANQFCGDLFAMATLRSLIGGGFPPRSDETIAREVAWRLTSGEWLARRRIVRQTASIAVHAPETVAAFPRERRATASPSRSPGPDAPLFPGDIDPAAIAAAQKEAAALGLPFCEECLKAQMAAT